jgi:hypothetical protein
MDLKKLLGATEAASIEKISIYLPDKDKFGVLIPDHGVWIEAAMTVMAQVNGGATCLPPAIGVWRSDEGVLLKEGTTVVYSYIRDPAQFLANVARLKMFLQMFGQETQQSEIMVEFTGEKDDGFISRAYFIRDYRSAA